MKTSIEKYQKIVAARGSKAETIGGIKKAMLATRPSPNKTPLYARGAKNRMFRETKAQRQEALRQHRADRFLSAINEYPYAVAQSSWAGGEHTTTWFISDRPSASCETQRAWSKNGKWSGNNTVAGIHCTQRAVSILRGHMVIGGLITLDLEPTDRPREYRAVWVEQGRGYSLKIVRGFLIRGDHVAGDDIAKARKKAAKARADQLAEAIEKRANRNQIRRDYRSVFVSVEDSLASGNCDAGTKNIKRIIDRMMGGDVGAVRADVLLSVIDDRYSRRAVQYAATHH